jgi:hypothetical protein
MQSRLLLVAALLATVIVYWIGLSGPFLLDDSVNLDPVQKWLAGETTWQHVAFGNHSGMLGRSLSMASFMLSAVIGGFTPFSLKLGNLVVHLACGFLGWQVLRRALVQDRHLQRSADLIALLLAAIWLLHPLNVSTVLYAVQRMAQLSTLFVLASLWAYLVARRQLAEGKSRPAIANLFVLFPLLLIAGLLSKENAAVAPGLCLVLELAYFLGQSRGPKPVLPLFFGLFVLLPALFVIGVLFIEPGRLANYTGRDFTLIERLLSQPRALLDYIGLLLFPRNPVLGIFTDDFPVSTTLLSPPSTALALLALLAISGFAIAMRKRAPSVFAGWFFFLVAHSVESSFLPLELYFEHRNYLPAFGLWLAAAGICELATRNVRTTTFSLRQLGILVASGFIMVLGFSTHGRARIWQNEDTIVAQALQTHPTSPRALLTSATLGLRTGNLQQSYDAMAALINSDRPHDQVLGHLNKVTLDCISHRGADPNDLREAVRMAQPKLSLAEVFSFELWAGLDDGVDCKLVSPSMVADTIDKMTDAATAQPDTINVKWRMRLVASQLYARAGRWDEALLQAELAWQRTADPVAGATLARAYAHNDRMLDAERTYREVAARTDPNSFEDMRGLAELRKFLNSRVTVAASNISRTQ